MDCASLYALVASPGLAEAEEEGAGWDLERGIGGRFAPLGGGGGAGRGLLLSVAEDMLVGMASGSWII